MNQIVHNVLESIKTEIEKLILKESNGGMSCGEVSLVPWEVLKIQ